MTELCLLREPYHHSLSLSFLTLYLSLSFLTLYLSLFSPKRFRISVTRFGEISPHWVKVYYSLWQFFDSFYLIWQNVEPTLANLVHHWANFYCC